MPSVGNYNPGKYYPVLSDKKAKSVRGTGRALGTLVKRTMDKIYSSKPITYRRKSR